MARPRTPTEVLELRGAFKRNPDRKRPVGAKSERGIGNPPPHLTAPEMACWLEVVGNAPAGVLTSADRPLVEIVARLLARFREDWLKGSEFSTLLQSLVRLGWTPADRSKVAAPAEEKPAGEFDFLQ